jgi:hypothetical protein
MTAHVLVACAACGTPRSLAYPDHLCVAALFDFFEPTHEGVELPFDVWVFLFLAYVSRLDREFSCTSA